ncbi:hypothetical protein FQA39_LY13675 [Lamprigera yunnana]|nr:hypothetical protein FQA39_LY13675 [Lamprigera yunnana]
MKTYLVGVICVVLALSVQGQQNDYEQKHNAAISACSKQCGHEFKDYQEFYKAILKGENDVKVFCECYLKAVGHMDAAGNVLYEEIKKLEKCNIATKACSEKLNVTYQKYNDYIQALPEGGEKIQLFSECFLRQLGYLNNNGEILYEDLKKTPYPGVPSDKYSNFVDLCKNQIGNSTAETSYKFSNCLMSNVNKFLKEQKPDPAKSGGTKSQQPKLTQQQQQQKAHEEIEDYHNALTKGGEKIQLFSECYLREMGYMNSNGEILYEEVKKIQAPCISPDKYSSIVDSCKNETGNNVSESSYKFYNCLSSNIQKFYKEQKLQAQQQHIQNQLQKQNRTIKACANKFKLSVQNVEDYSKVLAQGGPNVQSFSECYLRDSGYLDRNGNILYEEVKKTPPNGMLPDKYSSYVNLCKTEKGNSTAETSYKFLLCLQSNLNQTQQQVTEKPQVKQEPIVQPEKK